MGLVETSVKLPLLEDHSGDLSDGAPEPGDHKTNALPFPLKSMYVNGVYVGLKVSPLKGLWAAQSISKIRYMDP